MAHIEGNMVSISHPGRLDLYGRPTAANTPEGIWVYIATSCPNLENNFLPFLPCKMTHIYPRI